MTPTAPQHPPVRPWRALHRAPRAGLAAKWLPAALLAGLLALLPVWAPAAFAQMPNKYAGTYRIESWHALQARTIYQFFYLAPDGQFLLAAEWPGKEQSQFVGTWSVAKNVVTLRGQGHVHTDEGSWDTTFHRAYRVELMNGGFVLDPVPAKNHYGLMGWPEYYRFYRREPAPNLPSVKLPDTEPAMAQHIAQLLSKVTSLK